MGYNYCHFENYDSYFKKFRSAVLEVEMFNN